MDNDGGPGEGPSERELAAIRVLGEATTIPLDQEGPTFVPPLTYWQKLRQRIRCRMGKHAWSPSWTYRPLVPAEFEVARMLADGAPWPTYEVSVCRGCLQHQRRRTA